MEPLLLAIDQGTTSSRAFVFDTKGAIVSSAQAEFPQLYPQPGWVEHDPEAIWTTSLATARSALEQAESQGGQVIGIGIANQRETCVIWDRRTQKPISNAIVWQDRRTSETCQRLKSDGLEPSISEKTGLLLDPYFSATKVSWILDHIDGARQLASDGHLAFGTVDAFLLSRLTGNAHLTDATNAARTSLFSIYNNEWDDDLCRAFNVPSSVLPEVYDTVAEFGHTQKDLFGRSIPILAMVGDQQAAAAGQACFTKGDVKSTYGTGCFIIAETGDHGPQSNNRLLTTISRRIDGEVSYALEGSIFVAGASVQWLRDELGMVSSAAETEEIAAKIQSTSGVYLVPAFVGLGAPHWVADARGALVGLTRGAGRAQIVRATLESTAYQTFDLLEAMERDGAKVSILKVDGGMAANDWLMQFLADICNVVVERPKVLETTASGAALLAGYGAGLFDGLENSAEMRDMDCRFEPMMHESARNDLIGGWRNALEAVLS